MGTGACPPPNPLASKRRAAVARTIANRSLQILQNNRQRVQNNAKALLQFHENNIFFFGKRN